MSDGFKLLWPAFDLLLAIGAIISAGLIAFGVWEPTSLRWTSVIAWLVLSDTLHRNAKERFEEVDPKRWP